MTISFQLIDSPRSCSSLYSPRNFLDFCERMEDTDFQTPKKLFVYTSLPPPLPKRRKVQTNSIRNSKTKKFFPDDFKIPEKIKAAKKLEF